jgi:predicted O-methyltransferase YrrM
VARSDPLVSMLARLAARPPSRRYRERLAAEVFAHDPIALLQAVGPALNRTPTLDGVPLDLAPEDGLEFEDLAGFFASTSLDHGLIGMTVRQAAYAFGVARRGGARKAIEIGRWRGGSTILLAAAMGREGEVWSIDLGAKEERLFGRSAGSFDEQTRRFCERFGYHVHLLTGDSRTIEVETGEVDVVLIDGDHSYEVARSDFDRFGRRVRVGGAVLLDDAYPEDVFPAHDDDIGRLVREVAGTPEFELRRRVDRLAHLERVA